MNDIEKLSFEEALKELDSIVHKMETGDIKLSDSVAFYERGVNLKKHCEKILADSKLKVDKVQIDSNKSSDVKLEPFDLG